MKFLAPQEVVAAQNQGTPVIDIRPRGEWEAGHVPGSVNIEYLRLISGASLTSSPAACACCRSAIASIVSVPSNELRFSEAPDERPGMRLHAERDGALD